MSAVFSIIKSEKYSSDRRGELMSFIKKMFTLNVKDYLDISMDVYINIILFVIAVVLCLASFAINHHRAYTYRIIRQLLRREATSEDKAKTIGELHLNLSRSLKGALSRNGQLTDIVKRAGYVKPSYEEYVALMKDKRNRKKKINILAQMGSEEKQM